MAGTSGLARLQELADEIGEAGASADVAEVGGLARVMKDGLDGMSAALRDGLAMLKGKAKDDDEAGEDEGAGDEDEGASDEGDEDGDEGEGANDEGDEDGYDDAGYKDMRMGSDGDELVDATPLLLQINKRLANSERDNKSLRRDNVAMRKALRVQGSLLQQILETQLATAAPLMKGLNALGTAMLNVPATSVLPTQRTRVAVSGRLGSLDARGQKVVMAKAMQRGLLGAFEVQLFQNTGRFSTTDTADAAIRAGVESLIEGS